MLHSHEMALQRAQAFVALHQRAGIFVIPNAWDAGSARILESLGFEAIATTSAGLAFSLGKPDGVRAVTREETMANSLAIVSATSLPVAADLENGFGDDPTTCAATIRLAAESGLCGGSIEDASGRPGNPIYEFSLAVERVKAAVAAAKALAVPFMITARAENFINGKPDLSDTLRRLEAFAAIGADVLFAPGLRNEQEIKAAVRAVSPLPLNVLVSGMSASLTLQQLENIGVKRVSVGSEFARSAYGAMIAAAKEILDEKRFNSIGNAVSYDHLNAIFR
jgi:2-methylisocitrate lyase-like PEP mutase family enzyme